MSVVLGNGIEMEENVEITCNHCGYNLSDIYIFTGPRGIGRVGKCKKCGKPTLNESTQNPDYINPDNPVTVTCPFCHSTDCKKISASAKIGKTLMWGVLAAGTVSKTWHCNSCGSNFG